MLNTAQNNLFNNYNYFMMQLFVEYKFYFIFITFFKYLYVKCNHEEIFETTDA